MRPAVRATPRATSRSRSAAATGTINAVANVSGKAASMGEGTIVAVLTQLIKSFSANIAKA